MVFPCNVIFSVVLVSGAFFIYAAPLSSKKSIEPQKGEERTTIDISFLGPTINGRPDEFSGYKVQEWLSANGSGNAEEQGTYFEGDILFPNTLLRNGLISESRRWENGVVPVEIDKRFCKCKMKVD